ncbi:MAG: thioredoxin family protein [Flavobacteriaceae bacterium]|jgi:thiol-disulfide isomerase/thioredoxin|nr:thioredoxin family protein [Flavobacteriaceae bacterium]
MNEKKFLLILSIFGILMSCSSSPQKIVVNRKITTTDGETMLIGRVTRNALVEPEFTDWYQKEYESYTAETHVIKALKNKGFLYNIEIFFGTWCDDSQEQLPRFLKILDEIKFSKNKITLYAVNRKKESFYGEQAQKNIQFVPTFIVYKSGLEVGRIIETPTQSLELDLYKIMKGKNFSEEKKK